MEARPYASKGCVISTRKPDSHQLQICEGDRTELVSSARFCPAHSYLGTYAELAFRDMLALPSALCVCFSPLPSHLKTEAVHSLPHSHALTFQCSQFTITLRKLVRAHLPILSVWTCWQYSSAHSCLWLLSGCSPLAALPSAAGLRYGFRGQLLHCRYLLN